MYPKKYSFVFVQSVGKVNVWTYYIIEKYHFEPKMVFKIFAKCDKVANRYKN